LKELLDFADILVLARKDHSNATLKIFVRGILSNMYDLVNVLMHNNTAQIKRQ
jgi:hypothetical protein